MMERRLVWALGTGLVLVGLAAPASAQVHVEVGVGTPHVGAHVAIGEPRVHVVERYYEPVYYEPVYYEPVYYERVYIPYDRRWERERARKWDKHEREYWKDVRDARRDYEKDRRKDRREARRDRRW